MKKVIPIVCILFGLFFVCCKAEPHVHTFCNEWTYDDTFHWHSSTCGHDVISDKAEHQWDDGVVSEEATHSADGVRTYTCTTCGVTKPEVIPAKVDEHIFSNDWTHDADYHWHVATCGHDVVSEKAEHEWDDGTILQSPTFFKAGRMELNCKNCGEKKTEIIKEDGCEYDSEGFVIKRSSFPWHPYYISGETNFYFYDLSEEYTYSEDKQSGTIVVCTYGGRQSGVTGTFEIDEYGRTVKMIYSDLPGEFYDFEYSESGYLIKITYVYNSSGTYSLVVFDETSDCRILYLNTYSSSGELRQESEYVYRNEEGQPCYLLKVIIRNVTSGGEKEEYGSYTYSGDSNELIIEQSFPTTKYWFEYDDQNQNRLKKKVYEYTSLGVSRGYTEYYYYENGLPSAAYTYSVNPGVADRLTKLEEYSEDVPLLVINKEQMGK